MSKRTDVCMLKQKSSLLRKERTWWGRKCEIKWPERRKMHLENNFISLKRFHCENLMEILSFTH